MEHLNYFFFLKREMEVNHFFSLGCACYPSGIGNLANLRTFAGPFDWNAGSLAVVEDCLDTDFEDFLDKSQYTPVPDATEPTCGHLKYGERYFFHKNPVDPDHYSYFCRAINRFRTSLKSPVSKLFMFVTFTIKPTDLWSIYSFWKPDYDRPTIDRIVQKIKAKSVGDSHFLVWNVILGQPRNLVWSYEESGLSIANLSTSFTDFSDYLQDPIEQLITINSVLSHFRLVDSPVNLSCPTSTFN
jgi:hypothetical protein